MTTSIPTHQEYLNSKTSERNRALINASAPAAAKSIEAMVSEAKLLDDQCEAVVAEQIAAMSRIQDCLRRQSEILRELDHLANLQGIASSATANARQAVSYYLAGQLGDPYAIRNCELLCNEMTKATVMAPVVPAMITERNAELVANRAEVEKIAASKKIDVPKLIAALRSQSAIHSEVIFRTQP